MGANTFYTTASGASAKDAFWTAVERAQIAHGNAGYTGTIAEKHEFEMIPLNPNLTPQQFAEALIQDQDLRIYNKWGPAGCFDLGGGQYAFFGWASS